MSEAKEVVRNMPSPEGYELGASLARFADAAIAELAAEGEHVERCASCAFRAGTFPNGCVPTVMDALKCAIERVPFLCHDKRADLGGGHRMPCAGWFALVATSGVKNPGVAPWPFSDQTVDDVPAESAAAQEGAGDASR